MVSLNHGHLLESSASAKILGNVGLGYQIVSSRLYLAGEISGTFSDKRDFNSDTQKAYSMEGTFPFTALMGTSHTQSSVSLGNNEFDIDLKPGILIKDNFLVYARVGIAFNKLEITNFGEWTETVDENDVTLDTSASSHNSQNKVGFRIGAGTEYLLAEQLGITLDYIYTDYGSIKTRAENFASNLVEFTYNQVYGIHAPEVEVTTHAVMAGVVYHF